MTPRDAVEEAFVEHRGRVEAAAARILRDRDEARDVAADAYVAMLERGPATPDSALAWLLTSAKNRARNVIRSQVRAERRARLVAESDVTPAAALDDGGPARLVAEAAERLGARDRAALLLRHVEAADYDAIAAALETSPRQARVIVHRAAGRLRREVVRLIAEHHDAPADCERELLRTGGRRAHTGCDPCTAVLDEVHAMTASGVLPIGAFHAAERLIVRLAGSRPIRGTSVPGAERAGEIAAALAMSVTMLLAPSAGAIAGPGTGPDDGATATAALAAAPADRLTQAAGEATRATQAIRRTAVVERPDALREHAGEPLIDLRLAAAHVTIPDPLGGTYERSVDITTVEIATLLDERGRWDGLAFKIGTAAKPVEAASYTLDFTFGDACDARASAAGGTASFALSCYEWSPPLMLGTTSASQNLVQKRVLGEDGVVFVLQRERLSPAFRAALGPGATLEGIYATSFISRSLTTASSDEAPDEGRFDYTVSRG